MLVSYSQYWGDHPKLFADISNGKTPEERLLNVTRWFISIDNRWYGEEALQPDSRRAIMGFHLENKKAGVKLEGHCGQKSRFAMPAGIDVSQTGHALLTLTEFKEHYLITLPSLNIRGMVTELSGTTYILSSTELLTTIEYSTRGYFSGERHSFKATLKAADAGTPFYTAQGLWSGASTFTDVKTNETKLFFDSEADKSIPPEIKPLSEMGPLESHKLWASVTNAINAKDYVGASREKTLIEEAQRTLARARKEKGETQADALKVFELVEEDIDETGKAFTTLKDELTDAVGAKALKEDDAKPHWRLRQP
ncbi:Oxysterol binding protein [Modicella reniformis]|uniref:Oxysterol binding protein n=1 Tax=Modicella reniformis TaxID=1440133 RepID=A0A9P6SV74_9FUNG|nr:Oxysterol binding protein [Modicella reniformis]